MAVANGLSPMFVYSRSAGSGDLPLPVQSNFLGDWNMDNVTSAVNVQLEDSSGQNNHLLWEGTGVSASLIPNVLNGHTVLDVPGVNHFWGFLSPNQTDGHTVFIVVNFLSFPANRILYSGNVGSSTTQVRTTTTPAYNSRFGSGRTSTVVLPAVGWNILAFRRNGLGLGSDLWDETLTTEATGNNGNNSAVGFRLCADQNGAGSFVGQIARVVAYQTTLTNQEVLDTLLVLKNNYNL